MKKLGKKFRTINETIESYACGCYCFCMGNCTCNVFVSDAWNNQDYTSIMTSYINSAQLQQ